MRSRFWLLVAALAASVSAAPIRVGIFTGTGQGRFWHTSTHTAATQIASILAAPDTSGIGPDLFIHPAGVIASRFGLTSGTGTPTASQRQAFIDALDTTDVVILINNEEIGNIFSGDHRERLSAYSRIKGVISVHWTANTYGTWPYWDSLQGARYQNLPAGDRSATIRLDVTDTAGASAPWRFLNRGLADTSFVEEWISFTTNASVIRATPGLRTTLNVDEASYVGGLGGARAMGEDHPMSWYRVLPEGGRFFYTALGHRANLYQGGAQQPRFLRRQLYNAILWAAGYNEDGSRTVVGVRNTEVSGKFADAARVSLRGGALTVSVLQGGPHTVEIRNLEGRLVEFRRGAARVEHRFDPLPSHSMLVVTVRTDAGRATKLVAAP